MAKVNIDTAAMQRRARQAAFRGVVKSAETLREEALRLILNTPKSGRIYRRGNVLHQASAPGEAPASDTGSLVSRLEVVPNEDEVSAKLVANTQYAAFLEYGTEKMEPRPFMRPALAHMRDTIIKIMATMMRSVTK